MTDTVFIYALNEPCSGPDPTAGRTRYIGKAKDPYARYETHLEVSKRERTHKANWIRSLLKIGDAPILEILDEVPESEWQFWECEWIRLYRALGFRLTNSTDGGEGGLVSEEARAKIGAASRGNKYCVGRKYSDETRAKMSAARIGKVPSEATRLKLSLAHKGNKNCLGHKHTEETRKKMSIAGAGVPNSLEHCLNISKAKKGVPLSTAHRAAVSLAHADVSGHKNPMFGGTHSAEARAKISAAMKLRREKEKENKVKI